MKNEFPRYLANIQKYRNYKFIESYHATFVFILTWKYSNNIQSNKGRLHIMATYRGGGFMSLVNLNIILFYVINDTMPRKSRNM